LFNNTRFIFYPWLFIGLTCQCPQLQSVLKIIVLLLVVILSYFSIFYEYKLHVSDPWFLLSYNVLDVVAKQKLMSGDFSLVNCTNSRVFLYFSWIQVTCFWSLISIIIQCSSCSGKAEIDNHPVSELSGHLLGQPINYWHWNWTPFLFSIYTINLFLCNKLVHISSVWNLDIIYWVNCSNICGDQNQIP